MLSNPECSLLFFVILHDIHFLCSKQFLLLYSVEFNHLSEVLRSRTVDLVAGNENKRTEPSTSQVTTTYVSQEKATISTQVNGVEGLGLFGSSLIPCIKTSVWKQIHFFLPLVIFPHIDYSVCECPFGDGNTYKGFWSNNEGIHRDTKTSFFSKIILTFSPNAVFFHVSIIRCTVLIYQLQPCESKLAISADHYCWTNTKVGYVINMKWWILQTFLISLCSFSFTNYRGSKLIICNDITMTSDWKWRSVLHWLELIGSLSFVFTQLCWMMCLFLNNLI